MSDKNVSTDLRIKRTRKMLREALISLSLEKGFDTITVKDISERAMINRTTFYLHYEDKHDLLLRCMNEIFDELESLSEAPPQEIKEGVINEPPSALVAIFDHVAENAAFYRVMMGENGVPSFSGRLREYYTHIIRKRINFLTTGRDAKPLVPVDIAVSHAASSYAGIVNWWLNSDMSYSSNEMARYIVQLNFTGLFGCLGITASSFTTPKKK